MTGAADGEHRTVDQAMYPRVDQCLRLPESQTDCAAELLAKAFCDDPLYVHLLSDEHERVMVLPTYFQRFLFVARDVADVSCAGCPPKGVAIWVSPEQHEKCAYHIASARQQELPAMLGTGVSARFGAFLDWLDTLRKMQVREPYWYLMLLGVNPCCQNQGIGTTLVQRVLIEADEEGVSSYVETQHARNVSFYTRLGFNIVLDGVTEPTTGLPVWTLLRNPVSRVRGKRPSCQGP